MGAVRDVPLGSKDEEFFILSVYSVRLEWTSTAYRCTATILKQLRHIGSGRASIAITRRVRAKVKNAAKRLSIVFKIKGVRASEW
jgi:hypothetical protein